LTTQDIVEKKQARFKKLMATSRKKEIEKYIEQVWADGLITKKEQDWRMKDLQENADDLADPVKARELEIRVGFFTYKEPLETERTKEKIENQKAAKDFIKSIKKDRADREAKQLERHLHEEERALELSRGLKQQEDHVAQ